jgi:hypothetical protein
MKTRKSNKYKSSTVSPQINMLLSETADSVSAEDRRTWVKCAEACAFLGVSRPTIIRRRIPDKEGLQHMPGRIRYRDLVLAPESKPEPRYLLSDLEAMLREPRPEPDFTPKFHL